MLAVQIAFEFPRETSPVDVAEPAARGGPSSPRTTPCDDPRRRGAAALPPQPEPGAANSARSALPVADPVPSAAFDSAPPTRAQTANTLEASLRGRVSVPLRLTITDNRRTMISLRKRPDFIEVRLHHMFLHADAPTRDALADYLFDSDRHAAQLIGRFIEGQRQRIRRATARKPLAVCTAGAHHDLAEIFGAVNRRYFENRVDATITWGRDPQGRRARRSIKLGSYTSGECLIRVHPALDAAFVPRFFVEYIVYHEMLHHMLPAKLQRGRRDLHGPAFKARERLFADYDAALSWEQQNLDRLLSRKPRPLTS